jgi:hypothetical protein
MTTVGELWLQWKDVRLAWNITEYSGLWTVTVNTDAIWLPVMTLLNPANENVNYPISQLPIWVMNDGTVGANIVGQFVTACEMDLTYFPFDTQTCNIELTDTNYWGALLVYQALYTNVSFGTCD